MVTAEEKQCRHVLLMGWGRDEAKSWTAIEKTTTTWLDAAGKTPLLLTVILL